MRDFNTVKSDLVNHLNLSFRHEDGTIYWYEGTLETLREFLEIVFFDKKEGGRENDVLGN